MFLTFQSKIAGGPRLGFSGLEWEALECDECTDPSDGTLTKAEGNAVMEVCLQIHGIQVAWTDVRSFVHDSEIVIKCFVCVCGWMHNSYSCLCKCTYRIMQVCRYCSKMANLTSCQLAQEVIMFGLCHLTRLTDRHSEIQRCQVETPDAKSSNHNNHNNHNYIGEALLKGNILQQSSQMIQST
jgi:hypothetical protein